MQSSDEIRAPGHGGGDLSRAFVGGLFLGRAYLRTRSLGLHNAVWFLAHSLPFEISGVKATPAPGRADFVPWWLVLIGVALLTAGVLWFSPFCARGAVVPVAARESACAPLRAARGDNHRPSGGARGSLVPFERRGGENKLCLREKRYARTLRRQPCSRAPPRSAMILRIIDAR